MAFYPQVFNRFIQYRFDKASLQHDLEFAANQALRIEANTLPPASNQSNFSFNY
jgi:hypothetical protein